MLTPAQIGHFRERGFLVLEAVVENQEIQRLRRAARDIVDRFDIHRHRSVFSTRDRDRGRDRYFMDSAESVHCFLEEDAVDHEGNLLRRKHLAINKIGHALHDLVPEFTVFCRRPLMGAALRDLGCREPQLWQTMYIFKQPDIGGEVRWHQDATYLRTDPPSVTGIWVALEDATRENGCLQMQPGGHRSPLRELFEVDPKTRQGRLRTLDPAPWPAAGEAVSLEVPAGSVVFFHDHMPHCSAPNRSPSSREAFTMHAAAGDAVWCRGNWLQRPRLGAFRI